MEHLGVWTVIVARDLLVSGSVNPEQELRNKLLSHRYGEILSEKISDFSVLFSQQ